MKCVVRYLTIFIVISVLGNVAAIIRQYSLCGEISNGYVLNTVTDHCYKFNSVCATWEYARRICKAEGAHLAVINNKDEAAILHEIFFKAQPNSTHCDSKKFAFIGVHTRNRKWVTVFGGSLRVMGYNKWSKGQPNYKGKHPCGAIGRNGELYDRSCSDKLPFICKRKASNPQLYGDVM